MKYLMLLLSNRGRTETREKEVLDLLREIFVCVSIPVAAFAFTYMALDTLVGLLLR